jgi:hypothetical protein
MHQLRLEDLNMAARKSPKKTQATAKTADTVESKVMELAEQLGWLLGTVRGKADGLLANTSVQQEVARIRDSATELMERVNRASAAATQQAAGAINTAIDAAPGVTASARKVAATASTSAKQVLSNASASAKQAVASAGQTAKKAVDTASKAASKAAKSATAAEPVVAAKPRSGGTVDAPGKRHRKPPPQEKGSKRMTDSAVKQRGKTQFQPGHGARRG